MIIDIEQGSTEWIDLRRTKITATDAPIIMGLSPFKSADRLLWQKLGILEPDPINDTMREGQRIEPIARAMYEKAASIKVTPTVHVGIPIRKAPVHPGGIVFGHQIREFDWAMCSTDGLSEDGKVVIEIKSGNKAWAMAQNGLIPSYYHAQIEHILWLTGAEVCGYVACNGEDIKVIHVEPDLHFRAHMIEQEYKFYQKMVESWGQVQPYLINT
jgi:putative phage-type endonuclease